MTGIFSKFLSFRDKRLLEVTGAVLQTPFSILSSGENIITVYAFQSSEFVIR